MGTENLMDSLSIILLANYVLLLEKSYDYRNIAIGFAYVIN